MTRRELLLLATAAPLAQAQFTSSVRVVNVYVTVRDRKGELVRGLTRDDFEVREDGRKQELRYFTAESDAPLTLGLLFDLSGSQRSVVEEQRHASQDFLKQVLRDGDTAFFVAFDRNVRLFNAGQLAEIQPGFANSTGTALFDAISRACEHVRDEPGRKTLVILSDGVDTASTATINEAITAAQRSNVSIFPIRFYDREVFRFIVPSPALDNLRAGQKALEKLARDTGGGMYEISDKQTLADNYAKMQRELRSQYSLGYTPADGKSGYRKLKVTVKRKDLRVQARDGYFA